MQRTTIFKTLFLFSCMFFCFRRSQKVGVQEQVRICKINSITLHDDITDRHTQTSSRLYEYQISTKYVQWIRSKLNVTDTHICTGVILPIVILMYGGLKTYYYGILKSSFLLVVKVPFRSDGCQFDSWSDGIYIFMKNNLFTVWLL